MSTDKNNINNKKGLYRQRFSELAKLGILVFYASDLANLWQIKNQNTLHTTLKRYAKEGTIIRLQKGLYSLLPVNKIDPALLGLKILHRYGYIGGETVLINNGIIFQAVPQITIVSSISKKFSIADHQYYSRQLADKYLYNDVGIINQNGILIASVERAVADLLYFNSKYYFDANNLIDWKKVRDIQKQIGYPEVF
ncbi:MAG: hypothetical protein US83_C0010G0091 [Candidatus Falkowbacteria bacterium GW2011_GWC2_38_22]|uniref:Transcriptional regulator, AbiEi antitoxin, Type IV TA system n=1 Tax=Candidatus Falkowbacteria bacterium GW2011_GWE1_38_31 TaxID=1618638 RepID=A0A0G0K427_9BACT|nr:MAG: hypothetical protein US73_C0005G0091 [Candidatus Falkowbacteria bacterium GW2011_GWF2_38_1205]KKQ61055.1 MAG: hypothetical protein US83_C0010G0091 [Candidatus Falkowbacteria bacterium GW2011_GWC2_38_22]KKQ63416.1 MAG: hypothetical protein US84_C0006G0017 [Candidatus Falkowbacteria bacterium GW2011_GWF1_38_22]KKQ65513.1 MAG: hypothetical protein US87_C0007G0091 [Candidatus Falkowbacteria bacterium GW2011_GWE2_38_254]KKQ70180.1 MAG: hypothetical protein US91_C0006G0017 [Candidatus Falkowb